MQVLVVESRPESQNKLLEVLSWFNAVKRVLLASDATEMGLHGVPVQAIIVGRVLRCPTEDAVRHARQTFPRARIIAAIDGDTPLDQENQLRAAGADNVFDTRFSIWKTGLMLREILWTEPASVAPKRYSKVPGMQIENAA
jgi:hypothetical protein